MAWIKRGQKKPYIGSQVDWEHPLARGLVCCIPMELGQSASATYPVRDLVQTHSSFVPSSNPTTAPTLWYPRQPPIGTGDAIPYELAYNPVRANSNSIVMGDLAPYRFSGDFSILVKYALGVDLPAPSSRRSLVAKSNVGKQSYVLDLGDDTSGPILKPGVTLLINDANGDLTKDLVSESRSCQTGDNRAVLGTYHVNGTMALYADGRNVATTTGNDTSIQSTTAQLTIAQRQYAGSEDFFQGQIVYVMLWARTLTAADAAWLAEEPYAMITAQPAQRHYWFFRQSSQQPGIGSTHMALRSFGKVTVVTSGTLVRATANESTPTLRVGVNSISVTALSANAGANIYIGTATMNKSTLAGVYAIIPKGTTVSAVVTQAPEAINVADVYLDADTSGDAALVAATEQ